MAQITATITDDVVKKIDVSASEKGISRSKWVALAIDTYLNAGSEVTDSIPGYMKSPGESGMPSQNSPQPDTSPNTAGYMDQERVHEEVQRLMHEVESKNQVIRLQSDEISWLRGECAKITDRMLIALPAPRQHWWEFWKIKT
jgi:hypothetical protein